MDICFWLLTPCTHLVVTCHSLLCTNAILLLQPFARSLSSPSNKGQQPPGLFIASSPVHLVLSFLLSIRCLSAKPLYTRHTHLVPLLTISPLNSTTVSRRTAVRAAVSGLVDYHHGYAKGPAGPPDGGGTSGGPRLSFTLACSGIQMQSLKKISRRMQAPFTVIARVCT